MSDEEHHGHGQLRAVLGLALHRLESGHPGHVRLARAVDELPRAEGLGAGLAAEDAFRDPARFDANVHKPRVQQQLDVSPEQQFLEDDGQDLVIEDAVVGLGIGLVGRDRVERLQVRDDRVEDLALAGCFPAERPHAADGAVAARHGKPLDEHHLRTGSCSRARRRDARDAAANNRDVRFVPNGNRTPPLDLRQARPSGILGRGPFSR